MVAAKTLLAATGTLALVSASSFTTITTTSTEPATAAATITAPVAPPMPYSGSGPTEAMIARRRAWCTEYNAEKRRAPGWYESPDEYAGAIGYCVRFYLDEYKINPSKAGWIEESMDRTLGRKKFLVADFEKKGSPAPTATPTANVDAAASKEEDPVSEDPATEDEIRVNTAKMADILKESLGFTDEQLMELGFKLGESGFFLVHAPEENSEASSSLLWPPKFGRLARPLVPHPFRKHLGKEPAAKGPVATQPKVEKPKVEQPKVEQPKVEQPKVEQPKPKVEYQKPKVEDEPPAAKEPKGKEKAIAVEQPAAKEPKGKEPAGEQPKPDQPKAEQPKPDQPKADEPKAKDTKSKKSKEDEEMQHHDHPHGGHHAHPHHDEHDKEKEEEEKKKKEKEEAMAKHPYHPDHPHFEEEPVEDHPTPNPPKVLPDHI
ncbi:hypothetical protein CTAM01_01737 [Colletotrichum tamarilloi]|uniref:Uncharacterized protein n=1 Tax=Colletotrichum tamarilloi TaxID=1209934 RepID=A0ABQ9RPB8_9PEZI|nr:uncharacterized protein CTAM01_01737 [Colletotrichum tamarilloi]KAK1509614.1 hypothetical protein CTAM01_01737 [Colletotrichum tamarilloi]